MRLKKLTTALVMLTCVLPLSGCKIEDAFPVSATLQRKVDEQQKSIADLQDKVVDLTAHLKVQQAAANARLAKVETDVFSLWTAANSDKVSRLSVTERNYSVVHTDLGNLLFVVQDMSAYANGVKLKLRIGNPNAVSFDGIKIDFWWGKDVASYNKSMNFPVILPSGAWTFQDVVLTPAKTDEMGYLSVTASLDQVRLRSPSPAK